MNYEDLDGFIKSRPWYSQWLINVYAQGRTPEVVLKHALRYGKCYFVITSAFMWSDTPEKNDFWSKIASGIQTEFTDWMLEKVKASSEPKRFEYFKEEKLVAVVDLKEYSDDKPLGNDVIAFLKEKGIKYTKLEFDYEDECFKAYVESSGFRECGE